MDQTRRLAMIAASLCLALLAAPFAEGQVTAAAPGPPDPAAAAPAGRYVLDRRHASLIAKVRHLGLSDYTMRLDRLDAQFDFDPVHPEASKVQVTVDPASLDVGEPALSARFAREFLAADTAPQITFVSTGLQRTDPTHGLLAGDLTFHGVTRPITLAVTFNGYGSSLIGGRRMGFSATSDIKRSDFGSKAWLGAVGDEVHLLIEAEFTLN